MSHSKLEVTGLDVHKKLKHMVKSYGAMITGIPAETLGQNQAEMSLGTVQKIGNLKDNIAKVVKSSDLTQPTNSCGQASNEVCMLLLGMKGAENFEKSDYEILSSDGDNLTSVLPNKNLLIRIEVDRFNAPSTYRKTEKDKFDPKKADTNQIYLLEDRLLYLNELGKVIDLQQDASKCNAWFNLIQTPQYQYYALEDGFMEPSDGPEEAAICEINEVFKEKAKNLDCWRSTHSFTIFAPQTEKDSPRTLLPYQAYWTKHTLQRWFEGDKDEKLSQLGMEGYIEKLSLLGATSESQVRSDTYGELFSPPGLEKQFCAGINAKTSPLRVKYKVTEVNPELALENLSSVQKFIDSNYPGKTAEDQWELYDATARETMTKQLEAKLMPPIAKQEPIKPIFKAAPQSFFSLANSLDRAASLMANENLKLIAKQADTFSKKEREKVIEFFKTLPPDKLEGIKSLSDTAQKAWDEQYGLVIRKQ